MDFVSEKELKESGSTDNDEVIDHRPLYERLKEIKDREEAERKEQFSLKNQFRGLDEDETEFLDKINQRKNELERKRKQEEIDLLKQCFHAEMLATTASTSTTILKPKVDKSNNDSKKVNQKDVVKKLIIKRKSDVPAADLDEVVKKKEKLEEKAPEKSSVKATIENTKTDKKPTLLTGYAISSDEDE